MKRILLFLALLLPVALSAEDLRVAHIFSDHMVLQRESKVPVWGWGDPGKTVTVTPSWYGAAPVTTKVAKDGTWRRRAVCPDHQVRERKHQLRRCPPG